MGVQFDNLRLTDGGGCWWQGGVGSMTVPIETPGDMTALSFGAHIRARGDKDVVKLKLSFDSGANVDGRGPDQRSHARHNADTFASPTFPPERAKPCCATK